MSVWLRCYAPRPHAAGRIVCFGPAGGSASFFRGWPARAGEDVEVCSLAYPGRERRIDEPALETMEELAAAIAAVLAPRLDRPTVLFGHSMGASVAYEVCARLERRGGRRPAGLVVSGRPAPRRNRLRPDDTAGLSDEAICARLRLLGGTPAEVLGEPGMRELAVAACRTDFELLGRYRPAPAEPLQTPLLVYYGERDPAVDPDDVRPWTEESERVAGVRGFDGEHFFCLEHEAAVVAGVAAFLAAGADRGSQLAGARA